MVIKTLAKQVYLCTDHGSKTLDCFVAEERIQGLAQFPMKVMLYSPSHRQLHRQRPGLVGILISSTEGRCIDIIEKFNVVHMDLPRCNSHNGTWVR